MRHQRKMLKVRTARYDVPVAPGTSWPKCECGRMAEYVMGREQQPVCADGLQTYRDTGDRRVARALCSPARSW